MAKNTRYLKDDLKAGYCCTFPRKSCFISLASFIYLYLLCTFACYHSIHQWKSAQRAEHIRRYEYALRFYYKYCQAKTFPPEYSILPGTKLAYPFLSDSISSSVYIWGTFLDSLSSADVFCLDSGLFRRLSFGKKKSCSTLVAASAEKVFLLSLFSFFNGGLGFYYFMNKGLFSENFTRIFTAFYETPTNYVQANIQWHNIICDMLIPQRATLFGWAMLFPILILLYRAVEEKKHLILCSCRCARRRTSTDSYTLVPCSWRYVCRLCHSYHAQKCKGSKRIHHPGLGTFSLTAASLFALTYISLRQKSGTPIEANTLLIIGVLIAAVLVLGMLASLITSWEKQTAIHWGMFLGIVLVIALPILFYLYFQTSFRR